MSIIAHSKKIFSSLLTRNEKIFVLSTMACAFFISLEYSITRPASDAIFLSLYSFRAFPIVWILTVPLNFIVIHIYNRLLPRFGCIKVFFIFILCVIFINTFSAFFITTFSYLSFIQYMCKDIYILLMFKQLWSLIHTSISQKNAKYLFGIIFGSGGVGATLGSCAPSFFAVQLGSKNFFFFTAPIYILLFFSYFSAIRKSRLIEKKDSYKNEFDVSKKSFRSFFSSKYLLFILFIVISMQVSISLIDYQFNFLMEKTVGLMDLRTQYIGRIHTITNSITLILQFFGAGLFIHFLGLKSSHLFIPVFLCINAILLITFPVFSIASYVFICIKAIDYSIFSISREMLYIPMNLEEKFRTKAVIDVFAYRTAKAFGSLLLLALQYFFIAQISYSFIGLMAIIIFSIWAVLVLFLFKHHARRIELVNANE